MIIKRSKSVPDRVEDRQKCSTCAANYQLKGTQCACTPVPLAFAVIDIHIPAVNTSDGNVVPCSEQICHCEEKLPRLPKARRSKSLSTDTWEGVDTVTREELLSCLSSVRCKRPPSSDPAVLLNDSSFSIPVPSNGKSSGPQGTVALPVDRDEDSVVNGDVSSEESPKAETRSSLVETVDSSGTLSISSDKALRRETPDIQTESSVTETEPSHIKPDSSGVVQVTLEVPPECSDDYTDKVNCDEHSSADTTAAPSFMDNDSLYAGSYPDDDSNPIAICGICYDYTETRGRERNRLSILASTETWECNVCSNSFCKNCKQSYYQSRIFDGFTIIHCPGDQCTRIVRDEEIEKHVTENSFRVYQKNRVELENDPLRKTCPGCSKIYTFIENNIPDQVVCSVCSLRWCVPCYAPWHSNLTCQEFQRDINVKGGRKALKSWAKSKGKVAANARKCPKCKFYIERISGCDHMTCTRCSTDFCYKCGKRHKSMRLLGNHYSTYSFLGCKYNLFPNKPAARVFVRSTVLVSLACLGVVAVGGIIAAGSILVAASPIIGTAVAIKKCKNK